MLTTCYIIERGNVMGKAGVQLELKEDSCFARRILGGWSN